MNTIDRLYKILEQVRPDVDFRHTEKLVTDGYIDSFDIVTTINLIEIEFHVDVPVEEVLPENFESVEGMAQMVRKVKKE